MRRVPSWQIVNSADRTFECSAATMIKKDTPARRPFGHVLAFGRLFVVITLKVVVSDTVHLVTWRAQ